MSFHDHIALRQAQKAASKATRRALRATGYVDVPPWEHPQPIQLHHMHVHLMRMIAAYAAIEKAAP